MRDQLKHAIVGGDETMAHALPGAVPFSRSGAGVAAERAWDLVG